MINSTIGRPYRLAFSGQGLQLNQHLREANPLRGVILVLQIPRNQATPESTQTSAAQQSVDCNRAAGNVGMGAASSDAVAKVLKGQHDSCSKPGPHLIVLAAMTCISMALSCNQLPAYGADTKAKTVPSGTVLLPMTPKLDGTETPSIIAPSTSASRTPRSPSISFPSDSPAERQVVPAASTAASAAPAAQRTPAATSGTPVLRKPTIPVTPSARPTVAGARGAGARPGSPVAAPAPVAARPAQPTVKEEPIVNQLGAAGPKAGKVPVAPAPRTPAGPVDEIEAELARIPTDGENTLLKGTVQIVADDTEYDQNRNTFLGTGNAVATIAGQNSRLEADMILFDQNSQVLDARGNVKIIREGQLTTGSAFKFKVGADEYLITDPDTEVGGAQIIARQGFGEGQGMTFKQGTLDLPAPVHIARNPFFGTIQSSEDTYAKDLHPEAYVPQDPSFVFKARKMVYERYKDSGNVTVFGGKLKFKHFTVPLPKFVTTVGKESRVTFPVTPMIGNNIQVGGLNVGPNFNYAVGKTGTFSWAPLLQSGGRRVMADGSVSNTGKYGGGFRIAYQGKRLSGNLAYGSVSNLLVGDVRYIVNQRTTLQAGINRFLPDGLFGSNRARAIAEVVNWRGFGGIPFVSGISLRSSAGWMSDQPSLVNLSPQYAKLFTQTTTKITTGFRVQEQLMANSEPIFNIGDKKYGASMNLFGGVAAKAYSTGDALLMGQFGPVLNVNLNRIRLQGQLAKSGVRGQSPFVFDQFIQGSKSGVVGGDVKLTKWLTVGGNLGYNFNAKLLYQRSISAAIGPEDFKVLLTRDTIRGINRFGFDVLMGQRVPFNKLVLKGSPDQGQLSGLGGGGIH